LRLIAPGKREFGIILSGNSKYFDVVGKDARWVIEEALVCRIGLVALPVELCAERARIPELTAKILAKDSTTFEP
jgi:hypothetical protein